MLGLLRFIGIPFRLFMFILIHIVIGLFEPHELGRLDTDWNWVITGIGKYDRDNGRQLI